ncbi:MAG: Uma2 family endonuclease [Chloroflexaceae bacterium]|nr:Uma2 family endonuclease [Chloroflexaceae bacterium]
MTLHPVTFTSGLLHAFVRLCGDVCGRARARVLVCGVPPGSSSPSKTRCNPISFFVRTARRDIIRRHTEGPPDLVVEVLSPTTSATATNAKRNTYLRAGVPEYVEVNPAERTLTYCRLTAPDTYTYQVYAEADTITFACLPDLPCLWRGSLRAHRIRSCKGHYLLAAASSAMMRSTAATGPPISAGAAVIGRPMTR